MLKTPVLFLIFNRPDETFRVFEEIKKQKPKYLYIAADGPRHHKQGEKELCEQTRSITKKIDWDCEVKTLFREKNLGCKYAVAEAISWLFDNVEEGIILEDDCLPSQSFFRFCEEMLQRYRHDTRIMHISGENPLDEKIGDGDYYFNKIPHIWGWATWGRAWQFYDVEMRSYKKFKEQSGMKNVFQRELHRVYWEKCLDEAVTGNTWDNMWFYTVFSNNGLCINSNINFISNIGFGENSLHTFEADSPQANRKIYEYNGEFKEPAFKVVNRYALDKILEERCGLNEDMEYFYGIKKKTVCYKIKKELRRFKNKVYKNAHI